jgi:putative sterol carrier protein
MPKFPSEEWVRALCQELNRSESYAEAAKNWEGDFYFIAEPDDSLSERIVLYMDLHHGRCPLACAVTDESERNPEFRVIAPLSIWRRVIEGKLDPVQALMTRQLKLQGNIMKVLKAPKAARELVRCCTLIETDFSDEFNALPQKTATPLDE